MRPKKLVGSVRDQAEQMLKEGKPRKEICATVGCDYEQLRNEFGAKYTRKNGQGNGEAPKAD